MKKCKSCLETKELTEFRPNKSCKDGYMGLCRKCAYVRYGQDKTKPSNSNEYRRMASLKFRQRNFELHMLMATRSSAKKRGLEFTLTLDDIIIPELCPYLKIPLTRHIGKGKSQSNPSIDRIENDKGYVPGNIEIISDLANSMKRECSINELIIFAENVLTKHKKATS